MIPATVIIQLNTIVLLNLMANSWHFVSSYNLMHLFKVHHGKWSMTQMMVVGIWSVLIAVILCGLFSASDVYIVI